MADFQKAKQYIINLLSSDLSSDFIYHDLNHTLDVYKSATQLGSLANLNDDELLLLQTAALYHDVGLIYTSEGHEEKGISIVREVLPDFSYSEEQISLIIKMIKSTELPQSPKSKLDELLCDADLDYLGRDDFFVLASKLHLEWSRMGINKMPFDQWIAIEKGFLETHQYFTPEAQKLRNKGQADNLVQLKNICRTQVIKGD